MLLPLNVNIAEYNPIWPQVAAQYSAELQALGSVILQVHHIGSTSVPGLGAKPIIDLIPVVKDLAAIDKLQPQLESLGYQWHGELGISGRRYCAPSDESGMRLVQLHCFQENSPHIERHLAFRDYLRTHFNIAKAYEIEKRRSAQLYPENSHAYSDEKSEWVKITERDALIWFGNT